MRSDFDSVRQPGEKIAILTEENNRLHDEAQVADSLVLTLQEEVKVLTAERDEARKELAEVVKLLKWLVTKTRHGNGCHLDALAMARSGLGDPARRILEIVEGK